LVKQEWHFWLAFRKPFPDILAPTRLRLARIRQGAANEAAQKGEANAIGDEMKQRLEK